MLTVYLDRNVFADICELRGGLTRDNVRKLQNAVEANEIAIPASITLFEETIKILQQSDRDYDAHMKTVFGLIDKKMMVKPPNELLIEDCSSYGERKPYVRITAVPRALESFLDLSKNRSELVALAEEVTNRFKGSAESITTGLLKARSEGEKKGVGRPESFRELWDGLAAGIIENVLDRCSRNIRRLCRKRGITNMLEIKSLRIYAIYYCWVLYSGWFGVQGEPRKLKDGDAGDWFHAVQASAADVFVTQESTTKPGKLPFILGQIDIPHFQVINLKQLLERI